MKRSTTFYKRCEEKFAPPQSASASVICSPVQEKRFGQDLEKVTISLFRGDGKALTQESLVVPTLDFLEVETKKYDNGVLKNERQATSLVPGEPDPAFFVQPESYTKLGVADFMAKRLEARGEQMSPHARELWLKKEQMLKDRAAGKEQ
jgi:hypothetical protein